MIFHDTVTISTKTVVGKDDYGQDVYEWVDTDVPGEVRPVNSDEVLRASDQLVATYRVFVGRDVALDHTAKVKYRGRAFAVTGDVEQHTIGGRVHHLEFLARFTSG